MSHFLGTENIFEVIGNYPVLDQHDVLYSNMLSGSMYDDYVTGSLFTRTRILNVITTTIGERGRVFSKLGVDQSLTPSGTRTENLSYKLQPFREKAGLVRNIRIFSDSERYYDTLMPRIDEVMKVDGSFIARLDNAWEAVGIRLRDGGTSPLSFTNTRWTSSFPFEAKYSGIGRVKALASNFTAEKDVDGSDLAAKITKKRVVVTDDTDFLDILSIDKNSSDDEIGLSEIDAAKSLFGYGDNQKFVDTSGQEYFLRNRPNHRYESFISWTPPFVWSYRISPIVRGWKYGVHSAQPQYTSTLFRRDKFGQLRDMLEQRHYTAFVIDEQNSPFRRAQNEDEFPAIPPGPGTVQGTSTPETVVSVSFVKPEIINDIFTYVALDPTGSQASNLSMYCTSSIPYFDGMSKNR